MTSVGLSLDSSYSLAPTVESTNVMEAMSFPQNAASALAEDSLTMIRKMVTQVNQKFDLRFSRTSKDDAIQLISPKKIEIARKMERVVQRITKTLESVLHTLRALGEEECDIQLEEEVEKLKKRSEAVQARIARACYKAIKHERLERKVNIHFSPVRPYLKLGSKDCLIAPRDASQSNHIHELYGLLERLGLIEELGVKKTEKDGLPALQFSVDKDRLGEICLFKYPELCPYFSRDGLWCFQISDKTVENSSSIFLVDSSKGLYEVDTGRVQRLRTELLKEASAYFSQKRELPPVRCTISEDSFSSNKEILDEIFEMHDFEGLCIGENHTDEAPRKFLLDNLNTLSSMGVTTIFVEALKYDILQPHLDAFFRSSPSAPMPAILEAQLFSLDRQFNNYGGYLELVRRAKQAGIRIVGLETSISYSARNNDYCRLTAMNYVSEKIIRHEKGHGKYIAFMGNLHGSTVTCGTDSTVPGMANLLRCPHMIVKDGDSRSVETNAPLTKPIDHAHVILTMPKAIMAHLELIQSINNFDRLS